MNNIYRYESLYNKSIDRIQHFAASVTAAELAKFYLEKLLEFESQYPGRDQAYSYLYADLVKSALFFPDQSWSIPEVIIVEPRSTSQDKPVTDLPPVTAQASRPVQATQVPPVLAPASENNDQVGSFGEQLLVGFRIPTVRENRLVAASGPASAPAPASPRPTSRSRSPSISNPIMPAPVAPSSSARKFQAAASGHRRASSSWLECPARKVPISTYRSFVGPASQTVRDTEEIWGFRFSNERRRGKMSVKVEGFHGVKPSLEGNIKLREADGFLASWVEHCWKVRGRAPLDIAQFYHARSDKVESAESSRSKDGDRR